jgi:hypothetical protein
MPDSRIRPCWLRGGQPPRTPSQEIRRALRAAVCGLLVIGGTTALAANADGAAASPAMPHVYQTTITVNTSGKVAGGINSHYVGLSFESGSLNGDQFDNVGDLAQLLRNLGSSVLRFGGNSVDKSYAGISTSALAGLVRLVRASGWSVLYSENLGHYDAATVTADAKAVAAALGTHLNALACGNEPDLYHSNGLRPASYTFAEYLAQANACLKAIRAGAPKAPLEGADIAGSKTWSASYASAEAGTISWFGEHLYPLGCGGTRGTPQQVATQLLSPATTAKEVTEFGWASADAKVAHANLRMSETNTACDGGVAGVSDAYASALWVVDYLLTGAEHGVDGMNFHGGLGTGCTGYTPLCRTGASEYAAQPIYYGMVFTHMLGSGHLLPVGVSANSSAANIAAFALKPLTGKGLRLIIENLSQSHSATTIKVTGHAGRATVLQMTGPSLLATSGVQIQNASVAANGTITPGAPKTITCTKSGCSLTVNPYSAVLLTLS